MLKVLTISLVAMCAVLAVPPLPTNIVAQAELPSPYDPSAYATDFMGQRAYERRGVPAAFPDESLTSVDTNYSFSAVSTIRNPVLMYYMQFEIRAGSPDAEPHTIIYRRTDEPCEFFSWTVTTNVTYR